MTGAVDYISKPFQPEEVHVRVNTHVTMNRLKRSLAEKNEELRTYNERLEERVRERTAELASLNTIYERFVPGEFINLLKKESILEIHLGDQVSQQDDRHVCGYSGMDHLVGKDDPNGGFQFHQCLSETGDPRDQGL